MHLGRALASGVLSLATAGAGLLAGSFVLSSAGNQKGAATAFLIGVFVLALFGVPGLLIARSRARDKETARVVAHINAHGVTLYERYIALIKPSRVDHESAANWRREVERFRRSMRPRPRFIGADAFYELVTTRVAAMRQAAQDWGKRRRPESKGGPNEPVSITLPRIVEGELKALGWQAKAVSGPGLLGPLVLATKAGVKVVFRCERQPLTAARVERARPLKQHYRADITAIVCAGRIDEDARRAAHDAGLVLVAPGALKAIYPRARRIWRTRKDKQHAMAAGMRARAQAPGS